MAFIKSRVSVHFKEFGINFDPYQHLRLRKHIRFSATVMIANASYDALRNCIANGTAGQEAVNEKVFRDMNFIQKFIADGTIQT